MRIFCYLRRSVEEPGGLLGQRSYLEQWMQQNPAWSAAGWFADDGQSGYGFRRPGFLAMEEALKQRRADAVAVKDLSRLGRNYKEVGTLLERWRHQGIRLLAPGDGLDTGQGAWNEHFLALALKTMADECYIWDISQKEKAARRAMMLRGEFAGGHPPYGFTKQAKRLVQNETEWPVVKAIFSWHRQGKTAAAIARRLNLLGVSSPGQTAWSRQTVRYLLQNNIYGGLLVQGKRQRVVPKGKRQWTSTETWIIRPWQKEGEADALCGRILPDFGGEGQPGGTSEDAGGRGCETGSMAAAVSLCPVSRCGL